MAEILLKKQFGWKMLKEKVNKIKNGIKILAS